MSRRSQGFIFKSREAFHHNLARPGYRSGSSFGPRPAMPRRRQIRWPPCPLRAPGVSSLWASPMSATPNSAPGRGTPPQPLQEWPHSQKTLKISATVESMVANLMAMRLPASVCSICPGLHNAGVQIQVVRHHRSAQDANGHMYSIFGLVTTCKAAAPGPCSGCRSQSGCDSNNLIGGNSRRIKTDEPSYQALDDAESLYFEQNNTTSTSSVVRLDPPGQRQPEQQVQGDGRADDFGQVAGRNGDFAQHPQRQAHGPGVVVAASLGKVAARSRCPAWPPGAAAAWQTGWISAPRDSRV